MFALQKYSKLRPFVYHTLLKSNLRSLRATRTLYSAAELRQQATHPAPSGRRESSVRLTVPFGDVTLQDQQPLHEGNIDFENDWTYQTLLAEIDSRVFFWSGDDEGPIGHGVRHFTRYRPAVVIIRVPFADLCASTEPEFCKFNSGSPRCSGTRRSPCGRATLVHCDNVAFTAGNVVEVVFRTSVKIPDSAKIGRNPNGPWRALLNPHH